MKKKLYILCLSVLGLPCLQTNAQIITTVAGTGTFGFSGDGGQATAAELALPTGIAADTAGNVYFTDNFNNRVRKINASTGIIETIAGGGGSLGDGGQATAAQLNIPDGVAIDRAGNLYIADSWQYRIRKVDASTGIITTIAGNGSSGFSGDGAQATAAELNLPSGVAVDTSGNVYISDQNNDRIRKLTVSTGIITTVAGNGTFSFSGDGGQATDAELNLPGGIALDPSGNIYITDENNFRVRKMAVSSGIITTVAGNGTGSFSGDGGQATAAELRSPVGVAFDTSGNLYISDAWNARVRKVTVSNGTISTVAGNGITGFSGDGGPATAAELCDTLGGVTVDTRGNIYIADEGHSRIRKVNGVPAGINEFFVPADNIAMFPNPSKGRFIITALGNSGKSGKSVMEVYNISGERVCTNSLNLIHGSNNEIDMDNQPSGVYLYKIISDNGNIIGEGKLIIQK